MKFIIYILKAFLTQPKVVQFISPFFTQLRLLLFIFISLAIPHTTTTNATRRLGNNKKRVKSSELYHQSKMTDGGSEEAENPGKRKGEQIKIIYLLHFSFLYLLSYRCIANTAIT